MDAVRVGSAVLALICSSCTLSPAERMSIDKEVKLSPGHFVMPYQIRHASNGDFIIFGSTDEWDTRPWATRVTPNGGVRWDLVVGGSNGPPVDRSVRGQRFYEAIELENNTTLLCGI